MVSALDIDTARRLRARVRTATALVAGFGAWTVLVWAGRVRNVIDADDLDAGARLWRLALAALFVAGGLAVLAALWAARGRVRVQRDAAGHERMVVPPSLLRVVAALAVVTTVVWLLRGGAIVLGDYDAGFKWVHTVLAVGSIVLAALAWRAVAPRSTGPVARR